MSNDREYFVGIGGSPPETHIECPDFCEAMEVCWNMAYGMAEEQEVDEDKLDAWGEDDPSIGAGVCPEGDPGGYWPNVFIRERKPTSTSE